MKKINLLILSIITLIILPNCVKASTNVTLSLDCNELVLNESQTCKLYASVTENHTISGVDLEVEPVNLTIESFTKSGNFTTLNSEDYVNNKIVLFTTSDLTGRVLIGEFKLKTTVKDGVKLNFKTANYSVDEEDLEEEASSIEFAFTVKDEPVSSENTNPDETKKDSDSSLKSLQIPNVTLSPSFKKDTLTYKATTTLDNIEIKTEANSSKAKVTGGGLKTLKSGDNKFDIVVTAENGNKTTYTITVTKTTNNQSSANNNNNNSNNSDQIIDTGSQNNDESSDIKSPNTGVYSFVGISIIVIIFTGFIFLKRKKMNLFKKIK